MMYECDDNDTLHAELAERLGEFGSGVSADSCRVERVLKESPAEVTQVVWLRLGDGEELGPFVRKLIARDAGIGGAWAALARAQRDGLRTSHLPRVLACSEQNGQPSVLMEYVPGPTLRELVEASSPAEREELAAWVMPQLCVAVEHLHEDLERPLIHRDVTPSNVICSGLHHETAVLVDLGIAREWKPGADADTAHFGTRAYAAPEQFGFGQTDARSDVYALGLVAFFCLTGRDPEPADREAGFEVAGVRDGWRRVIARAAAFDPEERYGSARELRAAIEAIGNPVRPFAPASRGPGGGLLVRLVRARNVVILPAMALLVIASTSCAFDPRYYTDGPLWYNLYGYVVYMNYLILASGYLLMDKRWLREHVAFLRGRTFWQDLRLVVAVFVVLTVVLVVLSMAVG